MSIEQEVTVSFLIGTPFSGDNYIRGKFAMLGGNFFSLPVSSHAQEVKPNPPYRTQIAKKNKLIVF